MPQEPKYLAIQEFGRDKGWSIQKMCRFLGICRSAYYKWLHRTPSDKLTADFQNEKWLTDVTELKHGNDKKAYLSAVLDLYGRNIAVFSLGHSNNN